MASTFEQIIALTIFAVLVYALCVLVGSAYLMRKKQAFAQERLRLEKVLHDYNKAFEDDYKPF